MTKMRNFDFENGSTGLLYIFECLFNLYNCFAWDKDKVKCNLVPRLFPLRASLHGGKTLVQAGHVSPRFWEITIGTYGW